MKTKEREHHITHELFKLRNQLNQGNRLRNQITEVGFEMTAISKSEKHFLAKIIHTFENSKRILCIKSDSQWTPGNFSELTILEWFVADMLNGKPHDHFRSELVRTLAIRIKSFALRDKD